MKWKILVEREAWQTTLIAAPWAFFTVSARAGPSNKGDARLAVTVGIITIHEAQLLEPLSDFSMISNQWKRSGETLLSPCMLWKELWDVGKHTSIAQWVTVFSLNSFWIEMRMVPCSFGLSIPSTNNFLHTYCMPGSVLEVWQCED